MARNGSGTYSLPAGNPVVTGTTISSTTHNNTNSDIATALTDSLAKDGQTTPTADLPMGTYKHSGVGNATARNQYAAVGQVQDQSFTWCSTAGGTANAFTLSPSPAITAYAAGQAFVFLAVGTNTSTVTCAVSGLAAKAVQLSGSALSSGEIVSGKLYSVVYDGTQFQLETVSATPFIATLLNDTTDAAARTTLGAIGVADNNTFTGSNIMWRSAAELTSNFNITSTDSQKLVRANTSGGNITCTLLENLAAGTIVRLIKTNASNTFTVQTTGGDLIYGVNNSGVASMAWTSVWESWEFISDGSDWQAYRVSIGNTIGSPTGGDKGTGTFNVASGVYDDGTRILPLVVGGTGQTWYDKSGSRALSTVYQNTSGYPILVNVDVIVNTSGSGGAAIDYLVGSANPPTIRVGYGNVTSDSHDVPISFIVPNNGYYEALGGNSIRNWAEFRHSS